TYHLSPITLLRHLPGILFSIYELTIFWRGPGDDDYFACRHGWQRRTSGAGRSSKSNRQVSVLGYHARKGRGVVVLRRELETVLSFGVRREFTAFGNHNPGLRRAAGAPSQLQFDRNIVQRLIRNIVNGTAQDTLLAFSPGFVDGYFDFRLFFFDFFRGDRSSDLLFMTLTEVEVPAKNAAGEQQRTKHADD